jgi:phosphoserine phosphatase
MANGLEVGEEGRLTGEGIFRVEPNRKDEALEQFAAEMGIGLKECVAVGDSKYDVEFLKRAGFGVAIGSCPALVSVADVVIKDFAHFSQLLDYL